MQNLIEMLSARRPAGSKTERRFIAQHIAPLGVEVDRAGNLYKRIGDAPIMWSCHTDSVHHHGGTQKVAVLNDVAKLADKQSNCLGADDAAGIWLMTEMIKAQRPGLYIFHRAEEIGGLGSSHIADKTPELVEGIDFAVAFDRRGTKSVITHQGSGRCCSDAFAKSLGKALGMGHKPDTGGVFTDTANYTALIGECTNLSVGYENEHRATEKLDLAYLRTLRDRLLDFDANALTFERRPCDYDFNADDRWSMFEDDNDDYVPGRSQHSLLDLVKAHPHEVADWLEEYGLTPDEIEAAIYARGGAVKYRARR